MTFWTHFAIFVYHKMAKPVNCCRYYQMTMFYERALFLDCSVFQKCFEHILPFFAHCWMLEALCLAHYKFLF